MCVAAGIAICIRDRVGREGTSNNAVIVRLTVRTRFGVFVDMRTGGALLGFVLMRMAVRQRRRRREKPGSERESKPEGSYERRPNHALKLPRGRRGWNPG